MRGNRLATALAFAALTVALLGITPLGEAAANAVRVALFAQNAGKVNGIKASRTPTPGYLLPLDASGRLPASVFPDRAPGARGPAGPAGPQGPAGAQGDTGPAAGTQYLRTIVVSPLADAAASGTALLDALAQIGASAEKPYLLKIEPGTYHLGTRELTMKPYLDIEGSGEGVTTVTSRVDTGLGTIVGASNAELRFLTVKNEGGGTIGLAFSAETASPRLTHVTAVSSGALTNYGLRFSNGSPLLTNVTARATGGSEAVGLVNFGGAISAANSSFTGSAGSGLNVGVLTSFGGSVQISSSTLSGSGGPVAIGLRSYNGNHSLTNVMVAAAGGGQNYGVLSGQKHSTPNVTVNGSRVSGATNSVFLVDGVIRIGASLVEGPVGQDEGTIVCAASFSGSYQQLSSGCS